MFYVANTLRRIESDCMCITKFETVGYVQQQEEGDFVEDLAGSVQSLRKLSLNARKAIVEGDHFEVTAKELVLRRCGQREILGFEECYPTR